MNYRIPIAEHNAQVEAHSRKVFPPDPGKRVRVFLYDDAKQYWVEMAQPPEPREGFLNYPDKFEFLLIGDGPAKMIRRSDMTDAEFAEIPAEPENSELRRDRGGVKSPA